jgi:hypothetical protein
MTMDELNALYNNMSVYGDTYTSPTTTIPTDPNAGQPPILEPLIPAFPMQYINQGGDNDGGITTLAPDYGYDSVFDNTNITPKDQLQTNFEYDIEEGTIPQEDIDNNKTSGVGIQGLFKLLEKISPMANIMKLGKTGIETAQKYFADKKETERLEVLAQIEQAKKQKEAQEQIRNAEEAAFAAAGGNRAAQEAQRRADAATVAQANRQYRDDPGGQSYSGGQQQADASGSTYNDPFDPGGGEKDGGHIDGTNRRRYGMGGIVSL